MKKVFFFPQSNSTWNKNEPEKNIWRTRDVPEMAAALHTAPIFIDEVKSKIPDHFLPCHDPILRYLRS